MGGAEGPKKPQIPSWQRVQVVQTLPAPASGSEESTEPATTRALAPGPEASAGGGNEISNPSLEQGRKLLQDDTIKDAPTDRKIAFLESKGFNNSNIQKLVGVSRNNNASSDVSVSTSKVSPQLAQTSSLTSAQPRQPSREIPPIITYPEFLLKPQNPPPLISARLLLNTAYLAGAIAASIYGASKYIVSPMSESLTRARHDFASHTENHVEVFNKRLESLVSEVPVASASKLSHGEIDAASDIDSVASDPTELFHRDVGTQTSHSLSPGSSISTGPRDRPANEDAVTGHENRLKIIHSHLSEMLEQNTSDGESSEEISVRLDDLTTYLDGLAYSSSSYYNAGPYGGVSNSLPSKAAGKGEDDAVAKVRAEIRGIKGVLLSARNFPASRRASGKDGS